MYAFEKGDRVQWPETEKPASDNQRSLTVKDRIVIRYPSGKYYIKYLFENLIDRMIEDMKTNVSENFDNILTIIGSEGSGKSNIAHYVAKRYDPDLDLSKSMINSWEQFLESITTDPQRVYWFDEAILVAAGRDWMKEANKMLVSSLQTIRFMKLLIIFCIPAIDSIDVYIRTFRTRYILEAHVMCWPHDARAHRGYGELYVPKSKEERKMLPNNAKAIDFFRSKGFFEHPKMADDTYDQMKKENSDENLIRMKEQLTPAKSRYARDKKSLSSLISYMVDVQGLSYKEIADIAGMPYNTVKGIAWRQRNETGDDEY